MTNSKASFDITINTMELCGDSLGYSESDTRDTLESDLQDKGVEQGSNAEKRNYPVTAPTVKKRFKSSDEDDKLDCDTPHVSQLAILSGSSSKPPSQDPAKKVSSAVKDQDKAPVEHMDFEEGRVISPPVDTSSPPALDTGASHQPPTKENAKNKTSSQPSSSRAKFSFKRRDNSSNLTPLTVPVQPELTLADVNEAGFSVAFVLKHYMLLEKEEDPMLLYLLKHGRKCALARKMWDFFDGKGYKDDSDQVKIYQVLNMMDMSSRWKFACGLMLVDYCKALPLGTLNKLKQDLKENRTDEKFIMIIDTMQLFALAKSPSAYTDMNSEAFKALEDSVASQVPLGVKQEVFNRKNIRTKRNEWIIASIFTMLQDNLLSLLTDFRHREYFVAWAQHYFINGLLLNQIRVPFNSALDTFRLARGDGVVDVSIILTGDKILETTMHQEILAINGISKDETTCLQLLNLDQATANKIVNILYSKFNPCTCTTILTRDLIRTLKDINAIPTLLSIEKSATALHDETLGWRFENVDVVNMARNILHEQENNMLEIADKISQIENTRDPLFDERSALAGDLDEEWFKKLLECPRLKLSGKDKLGFIIRWIFLHDFHCECPEPFTTRVPEGTIVGKYDHLFRTVDLDAAVMTPLYLLYINGFTDPDFIFRTYKTPLQEMMAK